jgi:transposase
MASLITIEVKESPGELLQLLRKATIANRPRLRMLLLIQKGIVSTQALAAKTGVSTDSICNYKKLYTQVGLSALVEETRGGGKPSVISKEQCQLLEQRLSDRKAGFSSYKQAVEWINERFGLSMKYQAVNKYLKRHFHTRLKVGRKTHVQKDPLAGAAFKKGTLR